MKQRPKAFTLVGVSIGLVFLSSCSKDSGKKVFSQLPDPSPPTPTSTPIPTPTATPTPSPTPTVTPNPTPSSSPSACNPAPLKEFANVSSFSFHRAEFRSMDVSHGVVSPELSLDAVETGYGLEKKLGRYDVIGDQIELADTKVVSGGLAYGNSLKFRSPSDVYGVIKKTAPIDYRAVKDRMTDLQIRLVELPENGTVTQSCASNRNCILNLKGMDPTLNRFTLKKDQLKKRSKLVISIPRHATAVVVMDEQSVKLEELDIDAPPETIWTLGKRGGKFTIDFMTLTGTVFLLDSTLEMDQSLLMGRAISKEFTSTNCHYDSACSTIDSQEVPDRICL